MSGLSLSPCKDFPADTCSVCYKLMEEFGGNNCKNGYVKVMKDKKSGLLDKSGKQVLPVQYDIIGSAYKGRILLVLNEGTDKVSLK